MCCARPFRVSAASLLLSAMALVVACRDEGPPEAPRTSTTSAAVVSAPARAAKGEAPAPERPRDFGEAYRCVGAALGARIHVSEQMNQTLVALEGVPTDTRAAVLDAAASAMVASPHDPGEAAKALVASAQALLAMELPSRARLHARLAAKLAAVASRQDARAGLHFDYDVVATLALVGASEEAATLAGDSPRLLAFAAAGHARAGRPEAAAPLLEEARRRLSDEPLEQLELAVALVPLGRAAELEPLLTQADPLVRQAARMALYLAALERTPQGLAAPGLAKRLLAEHAAERLAMLSDAQNPPAELVRGLALQVDLETSAGGMEHAAETLTRARELVRERGGDAYELDLRYARLLLSRDQLAEARAVLDTLRLHDGEVPTARVALLTREGRFDEALTAATALRAHDPATALATVYAGYLAATAAHPQRRDPAFEQRLLDATCPAPRRAGAHEAGG